MRQIEFEKLRVRDLYHIFQPLKRGRLLKKNFLDLGLDFEFRTSDRFCVSLQITPNSKSPWGTQIYIIRRHGGITSKELLDYALDTLEKAKVEPQKNLHFIAHSASAEISQISDWFVDSKVAEFGKAWAWSKQVGDYKLFIHDTVGHFPMPLSKLGETLGFPKFSLEGVGGKKALYWYLDIEQLLLQYPKVFYEYAGRDPEIALLAWERLKKEYAPFNLDPHHYPTFTSLAISKFRRTKFEPFLPETTQVSTRWRQLKKWTPQKKPQTILDTFKYSLAIRELACRCYWGGINVANVLGYFPKIKASFWDFTSLYILALILQPLPHHTTTWSRVRKIKDLEGKEGFAKVDFEYPEDHAQPCLPVAIDKFPPVVNPLRGTSFCTVSEVLEALKQGAKIKNLESWVFTPKQKEIEHSLKPFMIEILKKKQDAPKGSFTYEMNKKMMVGIVGRFAYRHPLYPVQEIEDYIKKSGIAFEQFWKTSGKKEVKKLYKAKGGVGSTWIIEICALTLGRARAYSAEILAYPNLFYSTDGGAFLGNPPLKKLECVKEMERYGGGIRFEGDVDEIWVCRNRYYGAWFKNKVVHLAQNGLHFRKRDNQDRRIYNRVIRRNLRNPLNPITNYWQQRRSSMKDFFLHGVPLNSNLRQEWNLFYNWDYKRRLPKLRSEINIFNEGVSTQPYQTIWDAWQDWKREKKGIKRGRPRSKKVSNKTLRQRRWRENQVSMSFIAEDWEF